MKYPFEMSGDLKEALRMLVSAYVQDHETEGWSVGQGPNVPPSALPALIDAWGVVIESSRE